MKDFKKFLFLPLMAMVFLLLPFSNVFAIDYPYKVEAIHDFLVSKTNWLSDGANISIRDQKYLYIVNHDVNGELRTNYVFSNDGFPIVDKYIGNKFQITFNNYRLITINSDGSYNGIGVSESPAKLINMVSFVVQDNPYMDGYIPTYPDDGIDVPNFGWEGDGFYINNIKHGQVINGYNTGNGLTNFRTFDIEIYGKFYSDKSFIIPPIVEKTKYQNAFTVTFNGVTKKVGEGIAVKNIEWIVPPLGGCESKFKIVLQVSNFEKGKSDLIVSNDNFLNSVIRKDVTLGNDNLNPNPGGDEDTNVDVSPPIGDKPDRPDSLNPIDWIIYIFDLIVYYINSIVSAISSLVSALGKALSSITQELTSAVIKFTEVFALMPSPFPELITLSATVLGVTTVVKLIRG